MANDKQNNNDTPLLSMYKQLLRNDKELNEDINRLNREYMSNRYVIDTIYKLMNKLQWAENQTLTLEKNFIVQYEQNKTNFFNQQIDNCTRGYDNYLNKVGKIYGIN
jgi:hypothetical protein